MILVKYNLKLYQLIFTIVCLLLTNMALAGPNGILIIDLDRAYNSSKFGQWIRKDFQLKNESFNRGQHIFVQGQKPEKVYIVIDGEFEILRNMKN